MLRYATTGVWYFGGVANDRTSGDSNPSALSATVLINPDGFRTTSNSSGALLTVAPLPEERKEDLVLERKY